MSWECHNCCQANAIIDRLNERVAELESAQRWIPVGERLPEDAVTVLVHGGCAYYQSHDGWFTLMGGDAHRRIQWEVTHWQPLPPPYSARTMTDE